MSLNLDPEFIKKIERLIAEGKGQGSGCNYKPWLDVRSFPSHGLVSRVHGWTINRLYTLFSGAESKFFYVLDWSQNVVDIREQFPLLPIQHTLDIAERLGIRHPMDVKTKWPFVMTTDFLVDFRTHDGIVRKARSVKKSKAALSGRRMIEKMEIERLYWKENGVEWGITTEDDLPLILAKNVEKIHGYIDLSDYPVAAKDRLDQIEQALLLRIPNSLLPLATDCLDVDEHLGIDSGSCLCLVKHFIAIRKWVIDMNVPFDPANPLALLTTN
jgi:hypothetical protein